MLEGTPVACISHWHDPNLPRHNAVGSICEARLHSRQAMRCWSAEAHGIQCVASVILAALCCAYRWR